MNDTKDARTMAGSQSDTVAPPASPQPAPPGGAGVTRLERPGTVASPPASEPALPSLPDFLTGSEARLRDLLAFGMAVEAGRPVTEEGVETLRRKAEAELQAHAFRVLHNRVETIRREAMDEQLARAPRGATFSQAVVANLLAMVLAAGVLTLVWLASPHLFLLN